MRNPYGHQDVYFFKWDFIIERLARLFEFNVSPSRGGRVLQEHGVQGDKALQQQMPTLPFGAPYSLPHVGAGKEGCYALGSWVCKPTRA